MVTVAFGVPVDHAYPRYRVFNHIGMDRNLGTRALVSINSRLLRSHGTLHRRVHRARELRRSATVAKG